MVAGQLVFGPDATVGGGPVLELAPRRSGRLARDAQVADVAAKVRGLVDLAQVEEGPTVVRRLDHREPRAIDEGAQLVGVEASQRVERIRGTVADPDAGRTEEAVDLARQRVGVLDHVEQEGGQHAVDAAGGQRGLAGVSEGEADVVQ